MGLIQKTVLSSDISAIIQAIERSLKTGEFSGQEDFQLHQVSSTTSSNSRALGHFEPPPGWFWCPPPPARLWAHSLIITIGIGALECRTAQTLKLATCHRAVFPHNLDRSLPDRWCQCNWRGDLLKSVLSLAEKTFPRTPRNVDWGSHSREQLGSTWWN